MNSNAKHRPSRQPDLRLKMIPAACRRALATWPRVQRRHITFATSILFGALSCNMAMADLPKICVAGSCGAGVNFYNPANTSISSANAGGFIDTGTVDGNNRQIYQLDQLTQNAILNWESFNVDANVHLYFHNQNYGANSSTLNRIYQAGPSNIYGSISADGRLYLINQNGIIFRNGSQVDTHGLIASSLNMTDDTYLNGLLTPFNTDQPAFSAAAGGSGEITVEQGAMINATNNGTVALFGSNVTQGGTIHTADGQVILAAGNKIYITGSQDPGLRGWVVEVESSVHDKSEVNQPDELGSYLTGTSASLPSSTVTNTGVIEALRGNVSMVGLAINQEGLVHATTAVGENGSVILKARDKVAPMQSGQYHVFNANSARDGRVSFGTGSQTIIDNDVETANLTATDAQQPLPSTIAVAARQIHLESGSELRAVGGDIELRAQNSKSTKLDPTQFGEHTFSDYLLGKQNTDTNDQVLTDARIQLDAGSRIDVSGDSVVLPMSRNELQVRLTSNELNGEPNQVNGILRGETVSVDLRSLDQNGRIPIADISSAVNNIARTVDEHTIQGGTVTLNSQGSLVFATGASINVSGGSIAYDDGYITTTKLTANGKVYDIATADPNLLYDGIVGKVTRDYQRWGITRSWVIGGRTFDGIGVTKQATFYHGYIDGQDAGTVNLAAHGLILNGDLLAHTVNGENQRNVEDQAKGGQLIIGLPQGVGAQVSYRAPNVNIGENNLADLNLGDVDLFTPLPDAMQQQAYLSTRAFTQGGFNRVAVYSNGVISTQKAVLDPTTQTVQLAEGSALNLAPGGEVNFNAEQVRLYGDISTPGGNINVKARLVDDPNISQTVTQQAAKSTIAIDSAVTGTTQLVVGDNVHLSVAGQWTNDREGVAAPIPTDAIVLNAGKITLNASDAQTLAIGQNVSMDVQGGAWLNRSGKITAGRGGTIDIAMGDPAKNNTINAKAIFSGNLQLQGYALHDGGKLNLTMAGFDISNDTTGWTQRQVVQANPDAALRSSLQLPAEFFAENGFASITLNSKQGDIQIDNTVIHAGQANRILDSRYVNQTSGTALSAFSHVGALTPDQRKPMKVEFNIDSINREQIRLGSGASIIADPGSSIAMSNNSGGSIDIQGSIVASGGTIDLSLSHNTNQAYDPNLKVILGEQALLSTAGTFIPKINSQGQQQGQVLDGGSISLSSDGFIDVKTGARIDVSGTQAMIDLPSSTSALQPTSIGSNAGTIEFSTRQGLALNGELAAFAGNLTQRGGTLIFSFGMDSGGDPVVSPNFYNSFNPYLHPELALGRTINVVQNAGPQTLQSGIVTVDVDQVQRAGFDQLNLVTDYAKNTYATPADTNIATADIHFNGNVDLHLNRAIIFDSTRVTTTDNAVTTITAPYLRLGSLSATSTLDPTAATAQGTQLTLTGDLVDVVGHSAWQGFDQLTLHSHGDIRFSSNIEAQDTAELATNAQLNLTADQLYPTTLSDFRLTSTFVPTPERPDSIYIGHNSGPAPSVPFSVAGRLTLDATAITIDGTVRAPLGVLELGTDSTQRLTLTANGLVGTSLDGALMLFGRISNDQWYYQLEGVADTLTSSQGLDSLPQQQITFKGNDVNLQPGSTVDVKGGGDLLAWDYLPVGKLYDPLQAENAGNYFAILPAQAGQYAAIDPQEFARWSILPGDSVYLSGGGGIAAGNYAILPARYALLPGAMLVQELPNQRDRALGTTGALSDGTPIVAGYHTQLHTDYAESRTRSFALHPGSYAYQMAEFSLTSASDYLRAQNSKQRTPLDAGTLTFTPQNTLVLNGSLDFAPAKGGRGVEVNINSSDLRVVAQRSADITGQVQLVDSELNGLNAESILLGGTRTHGNTNTFLINTNNLTVDDGVSLQGTEWIFAAQQNLTIGNNVTVDATNSKAATQAGEWHGDANSALIRLSAGDQISLLRDGSTSSAPQIAIGTGSVLRADSSILVDTGASTSSVDLANKLQFNDIVVSQRNLTLNSEQVHLNAATTNQSGINASTANLNSLKLNYLSLQGRQHIDVDADTSQLPNANGMRTTILHADQIQIDTANLRGLAGAGDTLTLSAGELTALNSGAQANGNLATGNGSLNLQADKSLILGKTGQTATATTLRLDGFSQVQMSVAQGDITGAGVTTLESSGDVTLTSSRLTGQSGSELAINADGKHVTIANSTTAATSDSDQLGARLAINAQSIGVDGNIELHSGVVELNATGTNATDAVTVNGQIDVSGIDKSFADVVTGTSGGTVKLTAAHGFVQTASTSKINVSGATYGGDAGLLSVSAVSGNTQLQGDLSGTAAPGYSSGRFQLDTQTLSGNYSDLNTRLNSGDFHGERTVRLRGDSTAIDTAVNTISIAASDAVTANNVKFVADQGGIVIQGRIDASGKDGGAITLVARDDVTLATAASLDAHATATGGDGGELDINSTSGGIYLDGTVNVKRGEIDPVTGNQGRQGAVKLRIAQSAITTLTDTDSNNDKLRINTAGFNADYLQIEAVHAAYTAPALDSVNTAAYAADATTFMSNNATAINTALNSSLPGLDISLRAGIEIQSPGDLNLDSAWDLASLTPGDQPVNLTLRSAGNLNINASLSDGFNAAGALLNRRSADLSLVAGADTGSADSTAVNQGVGTVLVSNAVVRTGTGDIHVAAGNNIELTSNLSTIHTAGRASGQELDSSKGANAVKSLPIDGGNLTIVAGGNIIGSAITTDTSILFTDWLKRQSTIAATYNRDGTMRTYAEIAGWYIDFSKYQHDFASFGGGNLKAEAGGAINQAAFVVPTTGYYNTLTQQEIHLGKGNLTVHADGNINSGVFFVGDGVATITTDQAMTNSDRDMVGTTIGNVFADMGGQISAHARGGIELGMAVNPTILEGSGTNTLQFFTYADKSALALKSLSGDIIYNDSSVHHYLPPTVQLLADSGDIRFTNDSILFPSALGNFSAMAEGSILFQAALSMRDTPAAQIRRLGSFVNHLVIAGSDPLPEFTLIPPLQQLHANDPSPVTILTNTGDITLSVVKVPKALHVSAGQDLVINGHIEITHSHSQQDDVSEFSAGRDVLIQGSEYNGVNVSGPGQLYVTAGRNVDLGESGGLQSFGNLNNPQLANNGANITVLAGLAGVAPQYRQFMQQYSQYLADDSDSRDRFISEVAQIAGTTVPSFTDAMHVYLNSLSPQQQFVVRSKTGLSGKAIFSLEAIEQFQLQLTQYLRDLLPNQADLTREQARVQFSSLSLEEQLPMIRQAFFAELRTAGRGAKLADASDDDKNYASGYRALDLLFPGINDTNSPYHGDVNLFFSQIKTLAGGDITILVPGGIVNAGLAVQPPGADTKAADELGIVAVREGTIRIYSQSDVQVNQSRIFTLGAGDLLLWSSYGDIDAGRGSKSAISAPPPTLNIDSQGNVTLNFAGAVAGSGIRVICVVDCKDDGQFISTIKAKGPGIKISSADVDLVAPHGTVSAGEAGIGSAGNLFIAAQQVLGTNNIDIGGVSFGVPSTTPTVTPPTISSPETTGIKTGSIKPTEYQPIGEGNALMYLDVEVIGFGDQTEDEKRKKKQ